MSLILSATFSLAFILPVLLYTSHHCLKKFLYEVAMLMLLPHRNVARRIPS